MKRVTYVSLCLDLLIESLLNLLLNAITESIGVPGIDSFGKCMELDLKVLLTHPPLISVLKLGNNLSTLGKLRKQRASELLILGVISLEDLLEVFNLILSKN